MIQYLKDFFSQRIPCDRDCHALEKELECLREDLRIAKRDLFARNEQIQTLFIQLEELDNRNTRQSESLGNYDLHTVALEKEIEILQDILKSSQKREAHHANTKNRRQPQRFVAQTEKNHQSNGQNTPQ